MKGRKKNKRTNASFRPSPKSRNSEKPDGLATPNHESAASEEDTPPTQMITPGRLASDFIIQMEGLKQTLLISDVATRLAETQCRSQFEKFAREIGAKEEQVDGYISFEVPNEHARAAQRIFRRFDTVKRGKTTLASTFLIALVAEYDVFLSQVLRWLWREVPSTFALESKAVTVQELREMASLDEAESVLVEREIDDILRGSRTEQYTWLEKRVNAQLGTNGTRWSDFIEAHERRHLCVHTGGRASNQYLAACSRLGIKDLPQMGSEVVVDKKYVERAASTFSEMAVMTAQVIWRKICGEPNEDSDRNLSEVTYRLLEDGKFRLAATLLEFGLNVRKVSSERYRKMWVINLAQAHKRSGKADCCAELLENEDWSASGADFRISVAVLRDEADVAAKLMKEIGPSGPVARQDYLDWPLFEEFRSTKEFSEAFSEIFNEEYSGEMIGNTGLRFMVTDANLEVKAVAPNSAVKS